MKNLFKKTDKKTIAKSEVLDKKQLEKVIGGTETTLTTDSSKSLIGHELTHVVQQGK